MSVNNQQQKKIQFGKQNTENKKAIEIYSRIEKQKEARNGDKNFISPLRERCHVA
jgi:hypothetical protein